jgi:hypothetical protein
MREVDVSIRAEVGSSSILVIAECRDRSDPQDVTWIEQIVGKKLDVGADKAVAVSRHGFTAGAVAAAAANGIVLRTVENVDLVAPFEWLGVQHASLTTCQLAFLQAEFAVAGEGRLPTLLLPNGQPVIGPLMPFTPTLVALDGTPTTIDEAWRGLRPDLRAEPFTKVQGSIRLPWTFHLKYPPGDRFRVRTADGLLTVEEILLHAEVWKEVERLPISRLLRYKGADSTTLSEYAEVDLHYEGRDLVLGLQRSERMLALSIQPRAGGRVSRS